VNKKRIAIEELDGILRSERLGQVFDVLEPRAQRLAKQPSAVSFGVLFGALFLILGLIAGQLASIYLLLPGILIGLMVFAFTAAGIACGNLVSIGREGLRLERRSRGLERYIRPLLPVVVQTNQRAATKQLTTNLTDAIAVEIGSVNCFV
jgi:hypothetical protein